MKRETKNFLETNDSGNSTSQNLWDAAKPILRGKFIAIHSYLKKQKNFSNKQPNLTLKMTRERTKKS